MNLKKLWLISLLFLSSCATIEDKPVCAEINISSGKCVNMISGKVFLVDDENPYLGESWFELRRKSLVMPIDTYAEIKSFINKVCKKYGCSGDLENSTKEIDKLNGPE